MRPRSRRRPVPLRRRIFVWFGVAILLTAAVSWGVVALVGGSGSWRREVRGMKQFGANRFAEVWDRPAERRALAEELAAGLSVGVRTLDATGAPLETVGATCERPAMTLRPARAGTPLGKVELCRAFDHRHPVAALLALLAAGAVLWAASHKIARRIGRPLETLMLATAEIGKGKYDAEIRVPPHAPVEIVRLAEGFRDMAAKIEKQLAAERELLASVSHEVRSPLARIRLLLEMLRDAPGGAGGEGKLLTELEHEVEEIDDLVGGLLASSRVEFSALSLRPLDVVLSVRRALERAGLSLEPRVVGDPFEVRCDATLLARALSNLLDNAAKHAGGATAVTVEFAEDRVAFEVRDAGPGFSDGEEDRAFDPFYGNAKGSHDSLGLGLALVARIAHAHGGGVFAKNGEDTGATVGLWLPSGAGSAKPGD